MLADHLFQATVDGVTDPAVRGPLNDALSSLDRGQESRARNLNRQAQKAADALRDRTPGSSGSLVSWSVLERYFEEAALL